MDKPVYTAMTEQELWDQLQATQDDTFEKMAKKYSVSEANLSRLSLFRYANQRDSFNQLFRQLHKGSPE